jgi:hypothetical protein
VSVVDRATFAPVVVVVVFNEEVTQIASDLNYNYYITDYAPFAAH